MKPIQTELLKKWQLALRRYVIESAPSSMFAWSFGLDQASFREWIGCLFLEGMTWDNFGRVWVFDHIIPMDYFMFSKEHMLLYWGFLNTRPKPAEMQRSKNFNVDEALQYFKKLKAYPIAEKYISYLEKIGCIEKDEPPVNVNQHKFLIAKRRTIDFCWSAGVSSSGFDLISEQRIKQTA